MPDLAPVPDPASAQATRAGLRPVSVRWGLSAHARRLLTLATAGLVIALLTGRPEFAGAAAPALLLLMAWRDDRPAELRLRTHLTAPRTIEGDDSEVVVELAGHGSFDADLVLEPADTIISGAAGTVPALAGADRPGGGRISRVGLSFTTTHWGYRPVGYLTVTLRDRFRLTEGIVQQNLPWIDCRPEPAPLRSSIVLSKLPSRLGEHPARATGEGSEFAGIRQFVPGDRQRRVNWPATTRLGSLHLSTFAAERTQNVVVIADATADVGPAGQTTLDLVLRGAAGAVTRYLGTRDRVGLIVFGSRLTWLGPGQGRRHHQRLLDTLIASPAGWDRVKGLTKLPKAALPPGSLVLVFSPLLDTRIVEAVRDLRERGFGVLVIDVLSVRPEHDRSRLSALAGRVWQLEQDAARFAMKQIGVPVVHWDGTSDLDGPLGPFTRRALVVNR